MNVIDAVLLLIVALSVWAGWQKGFILGTVNLIVWIGSLVAGLLFYRYLGTTMERFFPSLGVWNLPLSFLLTVMTGRILLSFLFNRILRLTPEAAQRHEANHALGIIPGFINGLIYATLGAALLLSAPLSESISEKAHNSKIADRLATGIQWVDDQLSPIFNPAINQGLSRLTAEPESNETVELHFTVKHPQVREDLEAKMLSLVNEERTKRGLKPLKADPELTAVARQHSQDMFARGYFSHYTPEGKDPFDRMHTAGIKFLAAGENLALGQTLSICHQGLMNSPGHRANILNPTFGRLGIGILDGGFRGLMISQEFRN
jgi:uncharacterized protein YkwD